MAPSHFAAALTALSLLAGPASAEAAYGNQGAQKAQAQGVCNAVQGTTTVYVTATAPVVKAAAPVVQASNAIIAPVIAPAPSVSVSTFYPSSGVWQGTTLTAGAPVPSAVSNPNGPIYNPHDYTPQPFTWPGKPTAKGQKPPPRPTIPPFMRGGPSGAKYSGPAWLPKTAAQNGLTPNLQQADTNGNAFWGLPNLPGLPWSLSSNNKVGVPTGFATATKGNNGFNIPGFSMPSGFSIPGFQMPTNFPNLGGLGSFGNNQPKPTSSKAIPTSVISAIPTGAAPSGNPGDACGAMPDTGVTRNYDFTVSYKKIAPDGVQKNGIVINGGFPGPLIEANWGDWIQVTVHNALTDEGTSLHWHGLLQKETGFFDGVPAVTQCPIAPGASMVYRFRADHIGTSWYHSHYSAQYAGGAYGPIVIHGPVTANYDVDLGPVLLGDWFHQDYFTLINNTLNGVIPPSNNNLINGKMNYPCTNTTLPCTPNAGISKFTVQKGKKYRLRLINTSAEGMQKFTVDGHNLTIIANDFIPIQPYSTNVVTLGVGQRSDVILEANMGSSDAFWIRSELGNLGTGCSFTDGVSTQAVAALYYENANTAQVPTTSTSMTAAQIADCGNDPLSITQPFCAMTPPATPAVTETVTISFGSNGTSFLWFMNNQTFRGDYNDPVLLDVRDKKMNFKPEYNVFNFGTNSSIRLIVRNDFQFGAHPMHLHGHDYEVSHSCKTLYPEPSLTLFL